MKIILNQDGVKREIDGVFDICASNSDLCILINRLKEAGVRHEDAEFAYGWITIYEKPTTGSKPNTKPRPWIETGE